ncbi:hypothetical protein LCGC14_2589480 [marine sediment metagenome]|uniref:HNH nuclease domain-containing protein n=1 Tax=marine sediment metagenome TaxID=412755 RepID=A0A0F9AZY0_9ZZZZ
MNKIATLKKEPIDNIIALYQSEQSIAGVMRRFNINERDPRARRYVSGILDEKNIPRIKQKDPVTEENILTAAKNANTITEIIKQVGLQPVGGNYKTIRDVLTKNDVKLPESRLAVRKYTDAEVFCEHSIVPRANLARIVRSRKIFDYKCKICDNSGIWMGNVLNLHIDHINGISNDHRKENLRWLCPNCHSQITLNLITL